MDMIQVHPFCRSIKAKYLPDMCLSVKQDGKKMRNQELKEKLEALTREIKDQELSTVDLMDTAKFFIDKAITCDPSGDPDRLMATVLINECWKALGERD